MKITFNFPEEYKGGAGSGNFGHSGRPGKVGGSGYSAKHVEDQILSQSVLSDIKKVYPTRRVNVGGSGLGEQEFEDRPNSNFPQSFGGDSTYVLQLSNDGSRRAMDKLDQMGFTGLRNFDSPVTWTHPSSKTVVEFSAGSYDNLGGRYNGSVRYLKVKD